MSYEKMSCLYETVKDLKDRLHGTVCRYKDEAVYCTVTDKGKIQLYDVRAANGEQYNEVLREISPKDPDFDISSIELGYVNWMYDPSMKRYIHSETDITKNRVSFLTRYPARRYKQGIQAEMLSSYSIDGVEQGDNSHVLHSDGFCKSVLNDYPSLPEVIEKLSKGVENVMAISKEFALKRTDSSLILAFCEMKNIGWILPRSMKIEVPEGELQWLYQRMMNRLMTEY